MYLQIPVTGAILANVDISIPIITAREIRHAYKFTEADGWSGNTSNAYAYVTQVAATNIINKGPGDTLDVGIADKLGITKPILSVFKVKKNNADYTNYTVQKKYGTITLGDVINAGDDFIIWYKSNLNTIS